MGLLVELGYIKQLKGGEEELSEVLGAVFSSSIQTQLPCTQLFRYLNHT